MEYGFLSHYVYIVPIVLTVLYVTFFIVKKEYFESPELIADNKSSQKYTISEITKSVNVLLSSLNEHHSLVKIHKVIKISPFINFDCMLYNHNHPSIKNFSVKIRLPLSIKGKYVLESAKVSDSNEVIENGTRSLKDSQVYGNLKQ